jgi:DNA-binding transcriptional MocR family regulator
MLPRPILEEDASRPIYRQLYEHIKGCIELGTLHPGERLPATRELAGQLGLNRATISSAYDLLETAGLISGHVGRGSFVTAGSRRTAGVDWAGLLPASAPRTPVPDARISFSTSRPSEFLFPLEAFRATCSEVIQSPEAQNILQLGSPAGYAPLRRYLLERGREEGVVRDGDDILITSGCQQGFDLLQRVLVAHGETVLLEDPVYPGLCSVFSRAAANIIGIPVGMNGMDVSHAERVLEREPVRMLVVAASFQNPTGASLPVEERRRLLRVARQAGAILVENDIYGDLVYRGSRDPTIRQLDETGDTVLLRSFSKLAFPGLRVGWVIGPARLIARLAEAKQSSDLHTDHLAQAVLLRFAESGRLDAHRRLMLEAGRQRLDAALEACQSHLPAGSRFTRPRGGMNLWVSLPPPLDAAELLPKAVREGVSYMPGKYFAVSRSEPGGLRLSFAQLPPERIAAGIATLGRLFRSELERAREEARLDPAPALV